MRLFVAARISIESANAIAQCAEMLKRRAKEDMKWVPPANYHVTLKFLGPTRDEAVGAIRDALARACTGVEPFKFRCHKLGAFPSLDKASVVWAGAEAEPLAQLAARIDAAMAEIGFARETRPFHGHVTICRLRETRSVRELVIPLAEQMFSESRADGVSLMNSNGNAYSELHRIAFKRAETIEKRQTGALELSDETETDDGWPRGRSQ
jgi:2'-5' RNA ligase